MSKKKDKARDSEKMRAIEKLLAHGSRANEWREAGLLNAIEKVVKDEALDLSSDGIVKLMAEAKRY